MIFDEKTTFITPKMLRKTFKADLKKASTPEEKFKVELRRRVGFYPNDPEATRKIAVEWMSKNEETFIELEKIYLPQIIMSKCPKLVEALKEACLIHDRESLYMYFTECMAVVTEKVDQDCEREWRQFISN